jgi:hypothetical protein
VIVKAEMEHLVYVASHMQAIEKTSCSALMWGGFDPEKLARKLMRTDIRYCCLDQNHAPAVVGGVDFITPAVGQAWMFGTDDFPKVVREVTKATRQLLDTLLANQLLRIEIRSIETHRVAHQWYKRFLGFIEEPAMLRSYGVGGENFLLFSRIRGG